VRKWLCQILERVSRSPCRLHVPKQIQFSKNYNNFFFFLFFRCARRRDLSVQEASSGWWKLRRRLPETFEGSRYSLLVQPGRKQWEVSDHKCFTERTSRGTNWWVHVPVNFTYWLFELWIGRLSIFLCFWPFWTPRLLLPAVQFTFGSN
jgi:hypothetical protein